MYCRFTQRIAKAVDGFLYVAARFIVKRSQRFEHSQQAAPLQQIAEVLAAVEDGVIDEGLIDEACGRVLRAKADLGLLPLEE